MQLGTLKDEACWIRKQIQKHFTNGIPYGEQAILLRFIKWGHPRGGCAAIQEELDRHGIPNKVLREHPLATQAAVKGVIAYLRLVINPQNDEAFLDAVNHSKRGFGSVSKKTLQEYRGARPTQLSLYESIEVACRSDIFEAKQRAALYRLKRLILSFQAEMMQNDPVELLYHIIRKIKEIPDKMQSASQSLSQPVAPERPKDAVFANRDAGSSDDDSNSTEVDADDEFQLSALSEEETYSASVVDEDEELGTSDNGEEDFELDPFSAYGFDPSELEELPRALRRLLYLSAGFISNWNGGMRINDASYEEAVGLPSLLRLSYVAACEMGASMRRKLGEMHAVQMVASAFKLGSLPVMELLHYIDDEAKVDAKRVTISTIHSAKGLEWDVVYAARWTYGFTPSTFTPEKDFVPNHPPAEPLIPGFESPPRAIESGALEEERCLAHVAATRARKHLYVICGVVMCI